MAGGSDETKGRIQHVAAELFAQHGFHATSVREIVQAAGVTQPTLYYYFNSKDGLGGAVLLEGHRKYKQVLTQAAELTGRPTDRLAELLRLHFAFVREHPDLTRFFYAVTLGLGGQPKRLDVGAIRDDIIAMVREQVAAIMQSGGLDAAGQDSVTMLVLGVINSYTLSKLDGWRELPTDAELRQTVELLWGGIASGAPGEHNENDRGQYA